MNLISKILLPILFILALALTRATNCIENISCATNSIENISCATNSIENTSQAANSTLSKIDSLYYSERFLDYRVKDTIYILSDRYIEVNLNEQVARLKLRNDSVFTYHISSGNSKIQKGMATPSGIFTVQNKTPMATSSQFNDAKLYFWIGFNLNIGFHGLASNGYYSHLGARPSSHGCIRIGRDDGEELYSKIKRGTPVIVFDSIPARVLKFSSMAEFDPRYDEFIHSSSKKQFRRINRLLKRLKEGEYYVYNHIKYFLHQDTILRPYGLDVGYAGKVASKQRKPITLQRMDGVRRDKLFVSTKRANNNILAKEMAIDSVLSASDREE